MNPFLIQLIIQQTLKNKSQKPGKNVTYSSYEFAKNFRKFKVRTKRLLIDIFLISLGVFSAGFGLKGFSITQ